MERRQAALVGFAVGFSGWLLVGAAHPDGLVLLAAAAAVGAVAGLVAQRLVAVAGLLVGGLAAYPAALALGTIAFLGENWAIALVVFGAFAVAGFALGWLVGRSIHARSARGYANK